MRLQAARLVFRALTFVTPGMLYPGVASTASAQQPAVRFEMVTTCSEARGWRQLTAKTEFFPGERLCIYAGTLATVHEGRLDLEFHFVVSPPEGKPVFSEKMRFTREARGTNWAGWKYFALPADAPLGEYTVRVLATDHITGARSEALATFMVISAASETPREGRIPGRPAALAPSSEGDEEDSTGSDSAEPLSPELEEGFGLLRQKKYDEAVKAFKKANKREKNQSVRAWWGLARAYDGLGAYKNLIEACDKVAALSSERTFQAGAHNLKGLGLLSLAGQRSGDPSKKKELPLAEQAFRTALDLAPSLHIARFNLGVALIRQERDAEGVETLRGYLEKGPTGKFAEDAEKFIDNPRRAREPFVPDFTAVTLDGEYLDIEEMRGKVVVIDFWATWCKPCIAALPSLKRLHKKFAEDPVVLISISVDSDDDAWRSLIAKEKLQWPQVRDDGGKLAQLFAIRPIPTTFIVDPEGIIRVRTTGYSLFYGAELEGEIRKNLKIMAKAAQKQGQ